MGNARCNYQLHIVALGTCHYEIIVGVFYFHCGILCLGGLNKMKGNNTPLNAMPMDDHPRSFEAAVVTKAVNFALPASNKASKGEDLEEKSNQIVHTNHSAASTQTSTTESPFPELHFTYNRTYIFLYALFLIICNLVIPVVLFYPLVTCESKCTSIYAVILSLCFQ